MRAVIKNS